MSKGISIELTALGFLIIAIDYRHLQDDADSIDLVSDVIKGLYKAGEILKNYGTDKFFNS